MAGIGTPRCNLIKSPTQICLFNLNTKKKSNLPYSFRKPAGAFQKPANFGVHFEERKRERDCKIGKLTSRVGRTRTRSPEFDAIRLDCRMASEIAC